MPDARSGGAARPRRWMPALIATLLAANPAPAQQRGAPVAVAESMLAPVVREVDLSGTVTSPRDAALSAEVPGLVTAIHADDGDRVSAGTLLVELDAELARLALVTARAEAERAAAALDDARRRLTEGQALARDRSIAESDVKTLAANARLAEASLTAARAEADRAAAVLARHRITAPFPGVISRRLVERGEWVSPGTPLMALVAVAGLRFDFRVPQDLYPQIDTNTTVALQVDALPGRRFPGRITAVVPVSDPGVRSFLLRAIPAGDAEPAITPGMSARATLRLDTGRVGVVVPRDAVLRYPDGRVAVWTVEGGNGAARAAERLVRLGLSFGDRVEILEGLEAGATVVVAGNESLQVGQAISILGGD